MKIALLARTAARIKTLIGGLVFATLLVSPSICQADESEIFRIEEDWEMVVNDPDPTNYCPQVTFFTSPTNSDSTYFQLQMNYAADDEFSGGGFHVAAVHNESIVDEARSVTRLALQTDGDHIRWTSVMAVFDNAFFFAVRDGHSDEWGTFGGPNYLVEMPAGSVDDLAHYTPQESLDTVDIGFGANRVSSLKLLRVRVYYKNGNSITIAVNGSP
jgi:hypothetical protein